MFLVTTALALAPGLDSGARFLDLESAPLAPFLVAPDDHDPSGWNFSYTYLEAGAARYDVENVADEADVYYGRVSLGLLGFLYGFGQYTNLALDFENRDTDLIELGVGAHFGLMPNLDLFAEVGWLYTDISSDLGDNDDTGYGVEGGVRWMVLPWPSGGLELGGSLGYFDLDGVSDEDRPFFWTAGARVHFLEALSVGAAYEKIEDDDQVVVNVRWSF
jgi:hypothetical protein